MFSLKFCSIFISITKNKNNLKDNCNLLLYFLLVIVTIVDYFLLSNLYNTAYIPIYVYIYIYLYMHVTIC